MVRCSDTFHKFEWNQDQTVYVNSFVYVLFMVLHGITTRNWGVI
jgi:hypothetical protein